MTTVIVGESGGGGLLASLAIVVSVVALIFTIYWSFRSERKGYADAYWFRVVVGPKCVEPIIAFRDKWAKKLNDIDSFVSVENYREVVGEFQRDKADLEDSLWISRMFGVEMFAGCSHYLEDFEDSLADKLSRLVVADGGQGRVTSELKQKLSNCSVGMLSTIAKSHSAGLKVADTPMP